MLKLGSRGGDVVVWQNILRAVGYQIDADGYFGPATLSATKSYQASLGVTADGVVGESTLAAHIQARPDLAFEQNRELPDQNVTAGTGKTPWFLYAAAAVAIYFFIDS